MKAPLDWFGNNNNASTYSGTGFNADDIAISAVTKSACG